MPHQPSAREKTPTAAAAKAARRHPSPWLALAAMALLLAAGLYFALQQPGTEAPSPDATMAAAAPEARPVPAPAPTYVGGAACASCHAKETEAWQGSHHDRAMAVASESSVLGRFDGATFRHQGVTSTFFLSLIHISEPTRPY